MSALAHYIEAEGVPTTLLALVREHAAAIKPPRALWVPFELGRPLGAPEDPAFQRRALLAALKLMERPNGPVLEDFPDDAPPDDANAAEADEGWTCPVSFPAPKDDGPVTHAVAVAREIQALTPWHEAWKRRRGASGVGLFPSGLEGAAAFVSALADGGAPTPPAPDMALADALKLAATDVMTFYQEAANAQPGQIGGSQAVSDWFWRDTAAAKALLAVREKGAASDDKRFAAVAGRLILPHVATAHAS